MYVPVCGGAGRGKEGVGAATGGSVCAVLGKGAQAVFETEQETNAITSRNG
jgi:hypothetical protein